ncbi:MAG: hypothetical protein GX606_06060, partial [Elusimicrobia bacterium]|nr:hypothetical protein [Elusimicrobiota bacterium]
MSSILSIKRESLAAGVLFFALILGYCIVAGLSLFIALLLVMYALHLVFFRKVAGRRLLQISFLVTLMAATAVGVNTYSDLSPYYLPVAAVPMITMLLFSEIPLAFSMALITSALVTLLVGEGVDFLLIFFLSGWASAYVVRGARMRGEVLLAGLLASALQGGGYILFHQELGAFVWTGALKPLLISGILSGGVVLVTLR